MNKYVFKLVLFVVVLMANVSYAASDLKLEQGGMTKNEVIGSSVGGVTAAGAGVTGSVVAVSTAGEVAGLGAAGITSGLAAIGGGSMIGGIVVVTGGTAILVGVGIYGGYKLVQWWNTP